MRPFEIHVEDNTNIMIIQNRGYRTAEVVSFFEDAVQQQFEKSGPVSLLIDWTDFKGQPDAVEGLFMMVARASLVVAHVAIISNEKFEAEIARWGRMVEDVSIRGFPIGQHKQAKVWLLSLS